MEPKTVLVPRINANEDRVLLVKAFVHSGKQVQTGDVLAVIESTKATVEVIAPCSGEVHALTVQEGMELPVGSVLCHVGNGRPNEMRSEPQDAAPASLNQITAKARLRARQLGVDTRHVPATAGRVGVREVEQFADRQASTGGLPAMTSSRAIILGGGRHAACLIEALSGLGYQLVGCLDSVKSVGDAVWGGICVIGPVESMNRMRDDGVGVAFLGVGGATDNRPRMRLFEQALNAGFHLPPVVHRTACVPAGVLLGPGSSVLMGASIGPGSQVGANVVINQSAIVCHHCVVEDHAHLAPGGILAGGCRVGRGATIGMGATVFMDVRVGEWCLVYNNVAVTSDLPPHTVLKSATRAEAEE